MFTEKKSWVTLVKDDTKGQWLEDAFNALGINAPEAALKIEQTDKGRRLNQHIKDQSHLGNGFYVALKRAYPNLNLNYIIAGELPILLTKPESANNKALHELDKAGEAIANAKKLL